MTKVKAFVACVVVIACSVLTASASCSISDPDLAIYAAVLRFNANELKKSVAELRSQPQESWRDFSIAHLEDTIIEYVLPDDCGPPSSFLGALEPDVKRFRAVLPESPNFGLRLVFGQLARQGDDEASVEMDVRVGDRAIKGLTFLLHYQNDLWSVTDVSTRWVS